jgi:hypothetical protein
MYLKDSKSMLWPYPAPSSVVVVIVVVVVVVVVVNYDGVRYVAALGPVL